MKLRITDWDEHFENSSSRKIKRLDWVAIPNKTDGEGYTALVDHPNAAAHLGAWYAIVEAASKQSPRGSLPGGIPRDIGGICRSLGRMSRLPSEVFEEVLPRLLEIGWLEDFDKSEVLSNHQIARGLPAESATTSAESATTSAESATTSAESATTSAEVGATVQGTTGNYRELKKTHTTPRAPIASDLNGSASQRFEEFWQKWPRKQHRDQAARIWISVVSIEDEEPMFRCLDRFLISDQAGRNVIPNPENWLSEQSRDQWQGDWPRRLAGDRKELTKTNPIFNPKEYGL